MKKLIPILTTAVVFLLTFGATAHAAAALEPADGSLLDLMKPIYSAFLAGNDVYAGSLALVFGVALARRYGTARYPWLSTDAGSAATTMLMSFGGAMVAALGAGAAPTWSMAGHATVVGVTAMGGYAALRHLVVLPYLTYLATRGPAWLHKPADLILWVFQATAPERTAPVVGCAPRGGPTTAPIADPSRVAAAPVTAQAPTPDEHGAKTN